MRENKIRGPSDEHTESAMQATDERAEMPYGRSVANVITKPIATTWPEEFLRLGGSLPDAPLAHEIRAGLA